MNDEEKKEAWREALRHNKDGVVMAVAEKDVPLFEALLAEEGIRIDLAPVARRMSQGRLSRLVRKRLLVMLPPNE